MRTFLCWTTILVRSNEITTWKIDQAKVTGIINDECRYFFSWASIFSTNPNPIHQSTTSRGPPLCFLYKKSRLVLQRKWQPEIRPEIHHVEVGRYIYIVEIHHDLQGVFVSFQVVGAGFLLVSEPSTRSFTVFYQNTHNKNRLVVVSPWSDHWTPCPPSTPWHQSSPQSGFEPLAESMSGKKPSIFWASWIEKIYIYIYI